MDSKSLDKALNSILNTFPRTVAPLEAITYSVKKKLSKNLTKKKIKNFFFVKSQLPLLDFYYFTIFFPMSWIYRRPCLEEVRKTESELKSWELTVCYNLMVITKNKRLQESSCCTIGCNHFCNSFYFYAPLIFIKCLLNFHV